MDSEAKFRKKKINGRGNEQYVSALRRIGSGCAYSKGGGCIQEKTLCCCKEIFTQSAG